MPEPGDDEAPQRPRWLGWAIAVFMVLVVLGVANVGWLLLRPKPAEGVALSGQALVEANGCIRCHGVERSYVGPAFRAIADRYRGRPDAQAYLARKIREGGAGEWGRSVMPRHPQLTQERALQMAEWMLSLPRPGGED